MKHYFILLLVISIMKSAQAQDAKDPKATEVWDPEPKVVTPGLSPHNPPSDALILFDGKNLDAWVDKNGEKPKWKVENGEMTVVKGTGDIRTRQTFGDIQLHIEWRTPAVVESEGQGRGNSGIFFQDHYELQVLDSYKNRTYANGQAGSIYKQTPPLVNACKGPGEWQTYDVVFTAPKFNEDGSLKSAGRITVFHNGILIQNNTEIQGTTEYIGKPRIVSHGNGSLRLQDHSNPTSFRNIWVREL